MPAVTVNVPKRKNDWGEYVVKVCIDGKYQPDHYYHTDDREDAVGTANHMAIQYKRQGHDPVTMTA